ncbi:MULTISPECIES: ribosome maturation factor RimP [unclassified Nitratiruptor]|uniref:ribosome maturation factor RimP n=1 Tax=unclassified Nitratiruptor TaxID=2624044 RepID=UPI0019152691|nr:MULTISPECIES: ribosome maturation factor RimP [unclassified Nitratiruptor]BCD59762.1 ribosome maturation factor RimP [Nitratiruptor sp. YY08-10]BCD63686.1 ribosome maturation factor RimP [Nitratiruptor sp. YY08-14]
MNLEQEIKQIVESCGAKLYDIEMVSDRGKTVYRVTITAPEGVDLQKCVEVSNLISPLLDVHPPVSGDYNLEVSSPGVERKLKKPSHFELSVGEKVRVTKSDGETIEGTLKDFHDNILTLQTKNGPVEVPFDQITSAKTIFEW